MLAVPDDPFFPRSDVTNALAVLRNQPVGGSRVRKLYQSVLQLMDTQKNRFSIKHIVFNAASSIFIFDSFKKRFMLKM
jgi:hypothetical protein